MNLVFEIENDTTRWKLRKKQIERINDEMWIKALEITINVKVMANILRDCSERWLVNEWINELLLNHNQIKKKNNEIN